jgi:hypothetical protein
MASDRLDGEDGGVESKTVELDTTVIDSACVANIGLIELGDEIIELGGGVNDAGMLDRRVRVRGEVIIEPAERDTE